MCLLRSVFQWSPGTQAFKAIWLRGELRMETAFQVAICTYNLIQTCNTNSQFTLKTQPCAFPSSGNGELCQTRTSPFRDARLQLRRRRCSFPAKGCLEWQRKHVDCAGCDPCWLGHAFHWWHLGGALWSRIPLHLGGEIAFGAFQPVAGI